MNGLRFARILSALLAFFLTDFSLAEDDVTAALLRQNSTYFKQWNEGFIELQMELAGGRLVEVSAYWVGDRSRRMLRDFGSDGKREPYVQEVFFNRETYCRYSPASEMAECGRRMNFPELSRVFQVLPTETWNNIGAGLNLQEWLRIELPWPKVRKVVRTLDGYDVFHGKPEYISTCLELRSANFADVDIPAGEYVAIVHFNQHGLLESNQYIGTPPPHALIIKHEWSNDATPMPKSYSVHSRASRDAQELVKLKMIVKRVGNRLTSETPSLAVPPGDLPFGTKVTNKIGASVVVSYIGGDAGKAQYELNRSGKRLKEALSD